jgi:hypothetical protein
VIGERAVRLFLYDNHTSHFPRPTLFGQLENWLDEIPGPYTLALERTNWKVGTVDINILMLSIVYRGIGFPVMWSVLPKAGNSDTTERETVIEIFIDLFGAFNIACLLGDREFI